jgi:hypothetical protein
MFHPIYGVVVSNARVEILVHETLRSWARSRHMLSRSPSTDHLSRPLVLMLVYLLGIRRTAGRRRDRHYGWFVSLSSLTATGRRRDRLIRPRPTVTEQATGWSVEIPWTVGWHGVMAMSWGFGRTLSRRTSRSTPAPSRQ